MRIALARPAIAGMHTGNQTTAERWRQRLEELGHRVTVADDWRGEPADLLIAMHAGKQRAVIQAWRRQRPDAPLVLAMPGTDVYGDLQRDPEVAAVCALADRIVVLQPLAIDQLPPAVQARARTIRQSAVAPQPRPAPAPGFQACVVAHLREVKDPLRAAAALGRLPAGSPVRVVHVGGAYDDDWAARARAAAVADARWQWRGEVAPDEALRVIAASRVLVLTSRSEGGANVVTEAIACATPVLSTRIDGSLGILGADYPGYFPVGDDVALAALLDRCAREPAFLDDLAARVRALAPLVDPAVERAAWRALLTELSVV
ncbi:MAG TPA: selenoneine biosynthesis selenosugar synthase SenB [Kofleriaceae bacterium]|nr:selenoneine biosynthesis selenosugar synthase SenB [Kofleriaceae bacterium]